MPNHEVIRAARAKARAALAAMEDQEDDATIEAALADPDARPLDEARLARMRPVSATDAVDLERRLRGRPRLHDPKRPVSLRLDPDVLAHFRATGPGWQSRINQLLREQLPKLSK